VVSKGSNFLNNIKNLYVQLPKQHKVFITAVSALLLLLVIFPSEKATASRQSEQSSLEIGKRYQLSVPEQVSTISSVQKSSSLNSSVQDNQVPLTWQTANVKSGDSLAKIFKRLGFNARTTHDVISAKGKDSKLLKKLDVGDKLLIGKDSSGRLTALEYPLSKTDTLFVNLVDGKYQSTRESKTVEVRESIAHGVIKSNFWNAGIVAGLDDGQIISLANVFGWDIDFAMDIRKGDSFHVVYENKYIDGEFIGTGKILAAEFINQDDPFQAIRFTDGEYYSPDGKSMRKAFLRAPVNFKYISSNFKRKRFHPVQKRWKAHRGTDYAAKTGTPVVAAGNGKVVRAKYDKYNGHHVFIQHGNGIETKYIHFSKRAVKKGQRVKQGQVIGYVGSTGLAAGPHLHYEFLLNGVHRNPRTVKLPDAKPINKKYRQAFASIANKRLTELSGSKLALNTLQSGNNQAP
jgi:murein DD-endopeptidase MepM/ murein hydrolase activator NlpD